MRSCRAKAQLPRQARRQGETRLAAWSRNQAQTRRGDPNTKVQASPQRLATRALILARILVADLERIVLNVHALRVVGRHPRLLVFLSRGFRTIRRGARVSRLLLVCRLQVLLELFQAALLFLLLGLVSCGCGGVLQVVVIRLQIEGRNRCGSRFCPGR